MEHLVCEHTQNAVSGSFITKTHCILIRSERQKAQCIKHRSRICVTERENQGWEKNLAGAVQKTKQINIIHRGCLSMPPAIK